MSTRYYVKQLRLVPPEEAGMLGIPVEAPAFISPIILFNRRCPVCPITYTPLLYQTGYVTQAPHSTWPRSAWCAPATAQWPLIAAVNFHDLRHDFAHRVGEAGWILEEVAYYLGHVTKKGTPAIQTTARYTQVSREQIKAKLRHIRG